MDLTSRVMAYLSKCPPAISGQAGHNQTFAVACNLYNGFGLSENETLYFLTQYNQTCQPPWSERELQHKVQSAVNAIHQKPRGHLVGNGVIRVYIPEDYRCYSKPKPEPKSKGRRYSIDVPTELPKPMEDQARRFLMAAFGAGEAVSISEARLNDEGRCVPKGGGVTHSREEWIKKLDSVGGDPNKIFSDKDKCGVFVRINPVTMGGSKDLDVVSFRHALMEFDHCSIQEQWNLIVQSNIPCTAVLHSGNKSLHAWVKVDAKDRTDYTNRVKQLYDHFKDYKIDEKNKNPSRFSRLPGVLRGKNRQDLLAINLGAPSFDQWLIDKECEGIGQQIQVEDLLRFNPDADESAILGRRWLCRGGSCLWVGQSGVGKSALAMQAAISWGCGLDFFGVISKRKLKSLFIQAENDLGDLAEMMTGVIDGMTPKFTAASLTAPAAMGSIKENLIIVRDQIHTGFEFATAAQRLIEKHKPDLVWVDPLLSFIGDDVSSQKVCSQFLRNWLNPISEATGVVWMMLHHTGKPPSDSKGRKTWTATDYSYLGTGSSELVNWARAVNIIQRVDDETFKLMFAKRGKRAGAKDIMGQFTGDVFITHSDHGICWVQVDGPAEEEKEKGKPGRKSVSFDHDKFLETIKGEYLNATAIAGRIQKFAGVSRSKSFALLSEVKPRMTFDPQFQTFCSP